MKLVGSFIILVILVIGYIAVDYYIPIAESGKSSPIRDLLLSVISGIIPVFLLFVLSYYILNELNNIKEEHKEDLLSRKISNQIIKSMDWSKGDKFFSRKTDEALFIKEAEKKLFIVQETGSLISEKYRSEIVDFLERGGEIVLLLTTPTAPVSNFMSFRNASLNTADDLIRRAKQFESQIKDIVGRTKNYNAKSLEVRYISYPIDFTMVMADPNSEIVENRKSIIRLAGFKVPYEEKLDFNIAYADSPITFNNYKKQFLNLYYTSNKIILITGKSKVGKTTLLYEVINEYGNEHIEYILSPQVLNENRERIGFEIDMSFQNKKRTFAEKNEDGTYEIQQNVWNDISEKISEISHQNKILFLDEIGLMQINSLKFRKAILKLFSQYEITLIATISSSNEDFFNKLKNNYRSTVLTLTSNNKENIKKTLKNEINNTLNYIISGIRRF
jgi:nucleoside-triphosphatase THEP1